MLPSWARRRISFLELSSIDLHQEGDAQVFSQKV